MIIAKIHGYVAEGKGMLIQFSEPDETFNDSKSTLTFVNNEADLFRRLYVKNKVYVCDTLESWINQRAHSNMTNSSLITELRAVLYAAKHSSYEAVCCAIASHKKKFELLITDKSRFIDHYRKVIVPILEECDNVYTGKAKVHYY